MNPGPRIGLNAVFLEPGMGGLETYMLELVPALLHVDPSLDLTILCNAHGRKLIEAQPWAGAVGLVTPRASVRGLRALYEVGPLGWVAGRRFDLLHSPALTAPLLTQAANVVVLADTTWITVPDFGRGQAGTVKLWQAVVPRVARRADRVVTISASAADDIERHLGVSRNRIDVIPLGFGRPAQADATPEPELRARLGLGSGPIVLNVAMKKVHKNQLRLIQALPTVRASAPGTQLALAGASTPYEERLRDEVERLGLGEAVTILGYVERADLEGLYAASSVFAFPSLSEGFGLPVLEAMARGVPVVTSASSSLPEVAGEAALLVNPTSVEEIAQALSLVLTDDGTRTRLVSAGSERPRDFTWERCARGTLDTWQRALAARRTRGRRGRVLPPR